MSSKELYRQKVKKYFLSDANATDMPHHSGRLSFYATFFDLIDVEVINQNYYDANIYAIYGEAERRWVGNVPGVGTRSSFVLPWYPRTLAFEIDFVVGPGVFISDRVDVARGDAVQLTVPPNILASGFFRRLRR